MLRADESGITISRAALKALLAFAAAEDPGERLDVVAIRIGGGQVTARATDGHAALTLTGPIDGADDGQWDIGLPFVRACARALTGTDEIRIQPSGATVRDATVMRQVEHGEDYEEAEGISYHYDAARAQVQFPWTAVDDDQIGSIRGVSAVGFDAELWARMALVQKATGSRCRMALGDDDESPIVVTSGEDATAVLMPCKDPAKQRRRKGMADGDLVPEQAALRFVNAMQRLADDGETTVSIGLNDEEPVVVAKPRRGRKAKE